jgi:hypothetical protein
MPPECIDTARHEFVERVPRVRYLAHRARLYQVVSSTMGGSMKEAREEASAESDREDTGEQVWRRRDALAFLPKGSVDDAWSQLMTLLEAESG